MQTAGGAVWWLVETFGLYAACGLAVLLIGWPTFGSGRRFLRRWGGLTDPDHGQIAFTVRCMRQRRLLMLALMLLAPLTRGAMRSDQGLYHVLGSLLASVLLAEVLVALRRPRDRTRTALLRRRSWRELVPAWAVWLHASLTAAAVAIAALGLVAQPWVRGALDRTPAGVLHDVYRAQLAQPPGWYYIAAAVLALLAVYGVVLLAVLRRAGPDERVDTALRVGSARVALGAGIWLAAMLAGAGAGRLWFVVRMINEPAPSWLADAASVVPWLGLPCTVLIAVAWGSVVAAPRRVAV